MFARDGLKILPLFAFRKPFQAGLLMIARRNKTVLLILQVQAGFNRVQKPWLIILPGPLRFTTSLTE